MAHVQSYDHLITRAILSHYLATLAFIVQQSHINARPIARFNAFASQNGRLRSCDRCATTFSYAIISATVYDPNLNFSIARLFGRFSSCANCERAFRSGSQGIKLRYHVKGLVIRNTHKNDKSSIFNGFKVMAYVKLLSMHPMLTWMPTLVLGL